MEPKVSIIVSSYNGATIRYGHKPIIKNCLDSLRKTSYRNYNVVVADDHSPDNSGEYVKKRYPDVDVIINSTNLGYAKNNNNAIRHALKRYKPEYVLLLNDDIIVGERDWLKKLIEEMERDGGIGVEGCKLLYPDGRIQHAGIRIGMLPVTRGRAEADKGQYDKIEDVDAVIGAMFLVRREVIEKIGLLDDNYWKGPDDADYCIRARSAGYKTVYNGTVSLIHLEGFTATFSKSSEMRERIFYMRQISRTYFILKNYGTIKKACALLFIFGSGFFKAEGSDRSRSLLRIRLKDRLLWRAKTNTRAMLEGYKMYKGMRRSSGPWP